MKNTTKALLLSLTAFVATQAFALSVKDTGEKNDTGKYEVYRIELDSGRVFRVYFSSERGEWMNNADVSGMGHGDMSLNELADYLNKNF